MEIVCIIPARGGSKGIPRKNLKKITGHPLIAHSILHAKNANSINYIFVSTDDPEIADVAISYGAEVIQRPMELSGDSDSSESALVHALGVIKERGLYPDLVVFLQCTSPLRDGNDIDKAVKQLLEDVADSLLSVSPSHRFLWEKCGDVVRSINYDYGNRNRRQDFSVQYVENGSIYIFKPWVLEQFNNRLGGVVSLYRMNEESSYEIDSILDFDIVEFLMVRRQLVDN